MIIASWINYRAASWVRLTFKYRHILAAWVFTGIRLKILWPFSMFAFRTLYIFHSYLLSQNFKIGAGRPESNRRRTTPAHNLRRWCPANLDYYPPKMLISNPAIPLFYSFLFAFMKFSSENREFAKMLCPVFTYIIGSNYSIFTFAPAKWAGLYFFHIALSFSNCYLANITK